MAACRLETYLRSAQRREKTFGNQTIPSERKMISGYANFETRLKLLLRHGAMTEVSKTATERL